MMMRQHFLEGRYEPVADTILASEIKKVTRTKSGSSTSTISWNLLVNYEYEIDGQTYQSDRIAFKVKKSDASLNKQPSKKPVALSDTFVPVEAVTVYVSPKIKSRDILLHTPNYGIWAVLIGFFFFAGAL